jgi:homoserine O-succinyltransferase/O-acetyltransferase
VCLKRLHETKDSLMALELPIRPRTRSEPRSAQGAVVIGLVNNMGDEALKVTERQFGGVIHASAGDTDVELRLFTLTRMRRSPRALEYMSARYEAASAAMDGDLDALIITGAQPRAARLSDEDYWEELVELIDWAKEHTASTILSCLAAHAAVLHLDGVERRRLPEKCTGALPLSGLILSEASRAASAAFRILGTTASCGATSSAPAMTS